jgi:hypothetical protein
MPIKVWQIPQVQLMLSRIEEGFVRLFPRVPAKAALTDAAAQFHPEPRLLAAGTVMLGDGI